MSLAYFSLIVAIVSASILEIAGAKFGAELGTMAVAVSLVAASLGARNADREHFFRATSRISWVLLLIPALIALQLVPIWLSLAHPIWSTVHDAIGGLSFGYVTADVGLTGNALWLSLAAVSLIGVTVVAARDRGRAELILFVLSGVATVSALVLDLHRLWPSLTDLSPPGLGSAFGGLGLLLNLAVMQLAAERAETRHALSRSIVLGLCGLAGALICALAIFGFSGTNSAVAAAFGIVLLLLILVIRRLDLSALAAAALALAALIGAGIVLAFVFEQGSGSALLRLAGELSGETRATLERMLADTRWFGSGAGGFGMVARIYQSDASEVLSAPSAAVAIFVDMGWIGVVAAILAATAFLVRLFFGALARGRDSFFPAGSAACVCFALVASFAGPGLLHPAAIIGLSAIIGLGLSQSVSQSSRG